MGGPEPDIDEFLDALAFVGLGDEDISLGIDREIVRPVELSRPPSRTAERADHFERVAPQHVHPLIRAICDAVVFGMLRSRTQSATHINSTETRKRSRQPKGNAIQLGTAQSN